jgi:hypothetical protein
MCVPAEIRNEHLPNERLRVLLLYQPARCKIILIGHLSASYLAHPLVSPAMVLYIFKLF